jgi:hypothetical protein
MPHLAKIESVLVGTKINVTLTLRRVVGARELAKKQDARFIQDFETIERDLGSQPPLLWEGFENGGLLTYILARTPREPLKATRIVSHQPSLSCGMLTAISQVFAYVEKGRAHGRGKEERTNEIRLRL